jgi:hypothetical protein
MPFSCVPFDFPASMQELQYSYSWGINETANQEAINAAMRQFQQRR